MGRGMERGEGGRGGKLRRGGGVWIGDVRVCAAGGRRGAGGEPREGEV